MRSRESILKEYQLREHQYLEHSQETEPPWDGARAWANRTKEGWPEGEWHNEPDKVQWEHKGLACLAVRNDAGCWCGYVGVTEGHPLHGTDYDADDFYLSCHGGLTFSDRCDEHADPGRGICHVAEEDVWWFGFDCRHAGDASPFEAEDLLALRGTYRNLTYVKTECEDLAEQIVNGEW